jgi:hypothetical protein
MFSFEDIKKYVAVNKKPLIIGAAVALVVRSILN